MSKKERDLPKPGKTPFSRKRPENEGQNDLLMADQMALAAAEGKLSEYLEQEIPEGEYAKKLAMMMMGMTGLLPPGSELPMTQEDQCRSSESAQAELTEEGGGAPAVPEDVVNAVQSGDVERLKELLAREKQRRDPQHDETHTEEKIVEQQPQSETAIEKAMLDALIRVAADNSLSVDWLMARALKLYLEEYHKTGRL
jgi:hypothetical protein